jgi:hypothetical protein
MAEPIYSPDGNFIWDGSEWVPVSSESKQTVDMQDSVIGGDVVSNTNIQSSDAEVIKAAMEGVVASIREMNQPEPTAALPAGQPPTSISATTSTSTFEWKSWMSCIALSIVLLVAAFIVYELAWEKAGLGDDQRNADCYIGDAYNGTYDKTCQSLHDRIADDLFEEYGNLQAIAYTLALLGIGLVVVGIKFKIKPEGDIKIWLAASSIPAVLNALTRIGEILF